MIETMMKNHRTMSEITDRLEAVGVYEVTFEEWFECVLRGGCVIPRGNLLQEEPNTLSTALRGDRSDGLASRPVIYVNWNDAQRYVAWLRDTTGKSYRLLSEAEWEYVARAESSDTRLWNSADGQCLYANGVDRSWDIDLNPDGMASIRDGMASIKTGLAAIERNTASIRGAVDSIEREINSMKNGAASIQDLANAMRGQVLPVENGVARVETGVARIETGVGSLQNETEPNAPAPCVDNEPGLASVGTYLPNKFGLYDVIGNVHEWTQDCWHETYEGAPEDGMPWEERSGCDRRVARGGAWFNYPEALRFAVRAGFQDTDRDNGVGLRVALARE